MKIHQNSDMSEMVKLDAWGQTQTDYSRNGFYSSFFVETDKLLSSVNAFKEQDFILEDITGVDVQEGIMVLYHFDRFDSSARITLRTVAPHESKKVPSIVSIYSGADWHERECFDFFGVIFENHPNLTPLLLPDDLNIHPLLKEKDKKSFYTLLPFKMVVDSKIEQ